MKSHGAPEYQGEMLEDLDTTFATLIEKYPRLRDFASELRRVIGKSLKSNRGPAELEQELEDLIRSYSWIEGDYIPEEELLAVHRFLILVSSSPYWGARENPRIRNYLEREILPGLLVSLPEGHEELVRARTAELISYLTWTDQLIIPTLLVFAICYWLVISLFLFLPESAIMDLILIIIGSIAPLRLDHLQRCIQADKVSEVLEDPLNTMREGTKTKRLEEELASLDLDKLAPEDLVKGGLQES